MTSLDVVFRYSGSPGERAMRAMDSVREVYGIRRIALDEAQKTIRVEFDASRLSADVVASLLRRAGVALTERVPLI